jgi:hypothetical protein
LHASLPKRPLNRYEHIHVIHVRCAQGPYEDIHMIQWGRVEMFYVDERMVPLDHADSNHRFVCLFCVLFACLSFVYLSFVLSLRLRFELGSRGPVKGHICPHSRDHLIIPSDCIGLHLATHDASAAPSCALNHAPLTMPHAPPIRIRTTQAVRGRAVDEAEGREPQRAPRGYPSLHRSCIACVRRRDQKGRGYVHSPTTVKR